MLEFVARSSGVFFVPQMTLSVITVAIVLGYAVAFLRGELAAGASPWRRTLDPLAGLALEVGEALLARGFVETRIDRLAESLGERAAAALGGARTLAGCR